MKITFKLPKNKKKIKKERIEANPILFWRITLYFLGAAVLGAFAFGFYVYSEVNQSSFYEITLNLDSGAKELLKLNEAMEYFASREEKSAEIISSPAPFVDPSI